MACLSMGSTMVFSQTRSSTTASLTLLTRRLSSVKSLNVATKASSQRSGLLHCSFFPTTSLSVSSGSSFSGMSLGLDLSSNSGEKESRRGLVVRAGKKFQLCQTKRNRSRKSLARTHGFRYRMSTTSGRAVLKRRRAKGRWVLCTKSNPSSGKRA